MANPVGSFGAVYADVLAGLWEEFEDLIEAHYGRRAVSPDGTDRLRLKLRSIRHQLVLLIERVEPQVAGGGVVGHQAASLRCLANELVRLLDSERLEDDFVLACGTTMVLAQNRILDAAQRLALAN
jgi:hypothetical protein